MAPGTDANTAELSVWHPASIVLQRHTHVPPRRGRTSCRNGYGRDNDKARISASDNARRYRRTLRILPVK